MLDLTCAVPSRHGLERAAERRVSGVAAPVAKRAFPRRGSPFVGIAAWSSGGAVHVSPRALPEHALADVSSVTGSMHDLHMSTSTALIDGFVVLNPRGKSTACADVGIYLGRLRTRPTHTTCWCYNTRLKPSQGPPGLHRQPVW